MPKRNDQRDILPHEARPRRERDPIPDPRDRVPAPAFSRIRVDGQDDVVAPDEESDVSLVGGLGVIVETDAVPREVEIRLGPHYLALASTGLYDGAVITPSGTTGRFDITEGLGLYVDSTTAFPTVTVTGVTIPAQTAVELTNLATQPVTYISVDKDGLLVQAGTFPTESDRRDAIFLGVVVHSDNTTVNVVNMLPSVALDVAAQVQDVMGALGLMNLDGNVVFPNSGGNLSFDKSSGTIFKAGVNFHTNNKTPHVKTVGADVIASFRYRNRDSSEGPDVTVLDPTTYDLAGVTTSVGGGANSSTIQRVYMFPSGAIRVQRGQEVFASLSDAITHIGKEAFTVESNISENGLLLASVALRRTATDLTDTSDGEIFVASRFGELGSGGSTSVATLQDAYENSITPELTTNPTLGALSLKRGSAADTDTVLEILNGAGTTVMSADGEGNLTSSGASSAGLGHVADEDDMVGDSATKVPTQQSVKAYVDSEVATVAATVPEAVGDLDDVITTSPVAGDVLRHNGSDWVDTPLGISDLEEVNDMTPTTGDHLEWNGSAWISAAPAAVAAAEREIFYSRKGTPQTTTASLAVLTTWATPGRIDPAYTFSTSLGEVTFNDDWEGFINLHLYADGTANDRCFIVVGMQHDIGAGFVDVAGTQAANYSSRTTTLDEGGVSISGLWRSYSSGDKIRWRVKHLQSAADVSGFWSMDQTL